MDKFIHYKKYKYISIYCHTNVDSVAKTIIEHYDNIQYKDTLFIINIVSIYGTILKRESFSEKRIIFYNLEHYEVSSIDFSSYFNNYIYWLNLFQPDEIWEFCIENIKYLPEDLRYKTKFMPMRYTEMLYDEPIDIPKKYDLGLVGVLSVIHIHRLNIISDLNDIAESYEKYPQISMSIFKGYNIKNLHFELSRCKYILDTLNHKSKRYELSTQNQVRIFELIMRGYNVISEDISGINYFPDMIKIFSYPEDEIKDETGLLYGIEVFNILNEDYVDSHEEIREKYKDLTYTDESYENYKKEIEKNYKQLLCRK